jgi:hypothetical protein
MKYLAIAFIAFLSLMSSPLSAHGRGRTVVSVELARHHQRYHHFNRHCPHDQRGYNRYGYRPLTSSWQRSYTRPVVVRWHTPRVWRRH